MATRFGKGPIRTGEFFRGPVLGTIDVRAPGAFADAIGSTRGSLPNVESSFGTTSSGASKVAEQLTDKPVQGSTARAVERFASSGAVRSISRQFDDQPGGGFADETGRQAGQTVQQLVPGGGRALAVAAVLAVVAAFLWLLRPLFKVGEAVAS